MKKNILMSLLGLSILMLVSCKQTANKPETTEASPDVPVLQTRYSMKSAKVTSLMQMPGGMGTSKSILYFDDHGKKEMRENITIIKMAGREMNTNSRVIIRDGYIYTWNIGQKTGNKIKMDTKFDPSSIDYKKLTKELMDQFKMKEEGTADVLGKTCRVFSFEAEGMKGKSYVWENIPMKTEMTIAGNSMVSEVTDLQENVSIPASEFELPAEVEFKELQLPKSMTP
jgi:outer membrane lipoprotein-sorting protein